MREPPKLSREERKNIIAEFGKGSALYTKAAGKAGWSADVAEAVDTITPTMLYEYCKHRKFRPYPEPVEDENGTRYTYLLVEGASVEQHYFISFGDFLWWPKSTTEEVIRSITRIAALDDKYPKEIAEEIIALATAQQLAEAKKEPAKTK